MAYSNTGWKRSLTAVIYNETDGTQQTFSGMVAFTWGGNTYPTISMAALSSLSTAAYQTRLTAFKAWVESQVPGLIFADQTQVGAEAVINDATSCPIGAITS